MHRAQQADTIEELAEKLGLPADQLVATVERYNELAAKGSDDDFGKEPSRLRPVQEAPFYGMQVDSWPLCTLDGLCVNGTSRCSTSKTSPSRGSMPSATTRATTTTGRTRTWLQA